MDKDEIIVVQETEYTGAGKHIQPQLSFARDNGIDLYFGNPRDEVPGKSIILPEHPKMIKAIDLNMDKIRRSYIKNMVNKKSDSRQFSEEELSYIALETNLTVEEVKGRLK